jgi:uncharacterized membrane protein YfcA
MARFAYSIIVFVAGVALFVLGAYLVSELILKFLKFAVGLFLIFISIPMMLGSIGWWRFFGGRGRVTRIYRHD